MLGQRSRLRTVIEKHSRDLHFPQVLAKGDSEKFEVYQGAGLSKQRGYFGERSFCVNLLVETYGFMPLPKVPPKTPPVTKSTKTSLHEGERIQRKSAKSREKIS